MSQRQDSRRAARVRWREQAARLVGRALYGDERCLPCDGSGIFGANTETPRPCDGCGGSGQRSDHAARQFIDGTTLFDVALVRAYCERLVAEGGRLAQERFVFEDWTRERGMGPENRERGAFDTPHPLRFPQAGGWPGPLAREYGWERCKACEGNCQSSVCRMLRKQDQPCEAIWCSECVRTAAAGKSTCASCKGRGRTRKPGIPPGFANGDSIARTAKRLLATLDGRCPWAPSAGAQSSECGACEGHGDRYIFHPSYQTARIGLCEDCRGTGHNLAGVLPPVEHPRPRVSPVVAMHRLVTEEVCASARFEIARAVTITRAMERLAGGDPRASFRLRDGAPELTVTIGGEIHRSPWHPPVVARG